MASQPDTPTEKTGSRRLHLYLPLDLIDDVDRFAAGRYFGNRSMAIHDLVSRSLGEALRSEAA